MVDECFPKIADFAFLRESEVAWFAHSSVSALAVYPRWAPNLGTRGYREPSTRVTLGVQVVSATLEERDGRGAREKRSVMRVLPLPLLLIIGCAPDLSALEAVEVERASVVDVHLTSVALVGGGTWGRGTLEVDGMGGEQLVVPVTLRGGALGAIMDFTREEPDLLLELPGQPVTADQLLGGYRGSAEEFVVIVGVDVRHLHNEHGVGIDQANLALGLGVMFAYEWLRIRVDGSRELAQDTGLILDDLEEAP